MTTHVLRWLGATVAVVGALLGRADRPASAQQDQAPYRNRALPIEKRVDDLLRRMTLEEKVGQMTQADHASLKSASDVDTLFLSSVLSGGSSELPDG